MNMFDLTGRTAIVTGGSRGIGRGLSMGLADAGADLVIVYHSNAERAESAKTEIEAKGRKCTLYQQDLAETAAIPALVEKIWSECGPIHTLVNNAGIGMAVPWNEISPETWDQVLDVNLKAPMFMSQEIARRMIDAGIAGSIINIGSTNGFAAENYQAPYNASKGGLELLTQSLAIELGPHNITVNDVAPGLIHTEILPDISEETWEYLRSHICLHRIGTPEECAGPVVLLASDAGRYITGQHIIIDGGIMCQQMPR